MTEPEPNPEKFFVDNWIDIVKEDRATHPILFDWDEIEEYAKRGETSFRFYQLVARELVYHRLSEVFIKDRLLKKKMVDFI